MIGAPTSAEEGVAKHEAEREGGGVGTTMEQDVLVLSVPELIKTDASLMPGVAYNLEIFFAFPDNPSVPDQE